ncbi:MAG: YezD family protein [Pirellulales bacterium]
MEPISNQPHVTGQERSAAADEALTQIRDSLRGLRFGSVNIIVQDGVVIQIDRTEKRRLRGNRNTAP